MSLVQYAKKRKKGTNISSSFFRSWMTTFLLLCGDFPIFFYVYNIFTTITIITIKKKKRLTDIEKVIFFTPETHPISLITLIFFLIFTSLIIHDPQKKLARASPFAIVHYRSSDYGHQFFIFFIFFKIFKFFKFFKFF